MHLRVERGAERLDLRDAAAGQHARELRAHHVHAGRQADVVRRQRRDRALEVVDHREQVGDQLPDGRLRQRVAVALAALPVVVEVGLEPLQRVQVLVALGQGAGQGVRAPGLLGLGPLRDGVLVEKAVPSLGLGGRPVAGRGPVDPDLLLLRARVVVGGHATRRPRP